MSDDIARKPYNRYIKIKAYIDKEFDNGIVMISDTNIKGNRFYLRYRIKRKV